MTPDQKSAVITAATQAVQNAYAPYSKYRVGSAVLTQDGQIHVGCNVENVSYGLTVCAERVALFNAVAAGQQDIQAVVIANQNAATPCGACRQVIAELAKEAVVIVTDHAGQHVREYSVDALLPEGFEF